MIVRVRGSFAQALQQQQAVTKAESSAEEKRLNELRWKADADLAADKAERARAEQVVSGLPSLPDSYGFRSRAYALSSCRCTRCKTDILAC